MVVKVVYAYRGPNMMDSMRRWFCPHAFAIRAFDRQQSRRETTIHWVRKRGVAEGFLGHRV